MKRREKACYGIELACFLILSWIFDLGLEFCFLKGFYEDIVVLESPFFLEDKAIDIMPCILFNLTCAGSLMLCLMNVIFYGRCISCKLLDEYFVSYVGWMCDNIIVFV